MRGWPRRAAQRPLPSIMIATCRGRRSQSIDESRRSSRVPLLTTSAKSASTFLPVEILSRAESFSFLPLRGAVSIVTYANKREPAGGGRWSSQIASAVMNCARDYLLVHFATGRRQECAGDCPDHVTQKAIGGHGPPD